MKNLYKSTIVFILYSLLNVNNVIGWGTDKTITQAVTAQHSMAAKGNTLHAAVPVLALSGFYETRLFVSTDNGDTWNQNMVATAPSSGLLPIIKTKIVITSLDSVICLILQNNTIFFVNLESGITGQFTQTGVQEFDAATGSGNFIYLFVQEPTGNDIRRYGTGDGGLTWTGNTALVTGTGYLPRVTMSGNRLILNYYGPVSPDTVSSVIRAAFYNETVPGTLQAGTFSDVATNNAVKKRQFQSVINNGNVWFFFTEGDAQQVVKCRVSSDNGVTYQPEIVVGGDALVDAQWFAAAPNSDPFSNFGVIITYLTDSLSSPFNTYDKMIYSTASGSAPATFTVPTSPFNTYNDTTVSVNAVPTMYPVAVYYSYNTVPEAGIAWVGESTTVPTVYFDRYSNTVSLNEQLFDNNILSVYPNPASHYLTCSLSTSNQIDKITILNFEGKIVIELNSNNHSKTIDISSLPQGNYLVKASVGKSEYSKLFTIRH